MNSKDKIKIAHIQENLEAVVETNLKSMEIASSVLRRSGDGELKNNETSFNRTFFGKRFPWMSGVKEDYLKQRPKFDSHIDPVNPKSMAIMLRNPMEVLCMNCSSAVAEEQARAFPDSCDNCFKTGLIEFHEVVVSTGPFLIAGNVCEDCAKRQSLT
jgi:hypothetical protein